MRYIFCNYYKQVLLALQNNEKLYLNGDEVIYENGNKIDATENKSLNFKFADNMTLGKCGEYYASYIFDRVGLSPYLSIIDDHGIDFIINRNQKIIKIQVKTVRAGNYTFIKEKHLSSPENYYLCYIRVDDNGNPKAYLFSMDRIVNLIKKQTKNKNGIQHYNNFSYHEYLVNKSEPEYGISSAKKYYQESNGINNNCIADGWGINKKKILDILNN